MNKKEEILKGCGKRFGIYYSGKGNKCGEKECYCSKCRSWLNGYKEGEENIKKILKKYPISANFEDAMDVLDFKKRIEKETLAEVGKIIDKMLEKQRLEYKRCKEGRTTRMKNADSKNWGMVDAEDKNKHYNQVKQKIFVLDNKED